MGRPWRAMWCLQPSVLDVYRLFVGGGVPRIARRPGSAQTASTSCHHPLLSSHYATPNFDHPFVQAACIPREHTPELAIRPQRSLSIPGFDSSPTDHVQRPARRGRHLPSECPFCMCSNRLLACSTAQFKVCPDFIVTVPISMRLQYYAMLDLTSVSSFTWPLAQTMYPTCL